MDNDLLRQAMSELGKRSARKRLAQMTAAQKSAWGRAAQRKRTYERKRAEPFGTPNAGK